MCKMTVNILFAPAKFSLARKKLQSAWEQACLSELLVQARLEAWGWSHILEKTQHTQHLRAEEECIMASCLQPCGLLLSLSDMQAPDGQYRMVDTGVRLEHQGGSLSAWSEVWRSYACCSLGAGNLQWRSELG